MLFKLIEKSSILSRRFPKKHPPGKTNQKVCFMPDCQNFDKLVQDANPFVDKTLLIYEILKSHKKLILFTRPRSWGKTLNMTMLHSFFQADVDKTTGEIFYNKKSKKYLFQNLKIKDAYLNYDPVSGQKKETRLIDCQGSFPVIRIAFGGDIQTDPRDVKEYFKYMIVPAFKEHSYLLNVKNILVGQNREVFEKIVCDGNFEGCGLTWSLCFLIIALNKHYNRKVVVLIDGYDRYLMNLAAADSPIYKYALNLTTSFFSPLELNTEMVQLAVLTGESRVAKWEISTNLELFEDDTVTWWQFPEFFGFTESEVDDLISSLLQFKPDLKNIDIKQNVKNMYNGYTRNKKNIYNPSSIMKCLDNLYTNQDQPFKIFWTNTRSFNIIENALKKLRYTENFEKLLIDGCIEFEYKYFYSFKSMHNSEYKFLSFLVDAGYLTTINDEIFTIPNNEAKDYFYNDLLRVWVKKIHEDLDLEKMKNFNMEDCKEYTESFQKHVLDKARYSQVLESNFQKLIVLPYIASISKKHYYEMEMRTSKRTKIEIVFQPIKDKTTNVILFELKKVFGLGDERKLIEEAYYTMFDEEYTDHLLNLANEEKNRHWATIDLRAAVFSKDLKKDKWVLSMHEVKLTREELDNATKNFQNQKESLKDKMVDFLEKFKLSSSTSN